jgi:hypothetical protein
MLTIYVYILRTGTAIEFRDLCVALNIVYNALYAFDWAIADFLAQPPARRSLRIVADTASVVPASERLQLVQMWMATGLLPGWMQYSGASSALGTLRDYAAQAFYLRSSGGATSSTLAALKTSIIQPRVNTLTAAGASSSQINSAVLTYFTQPAQQIDAVQGSGLMGTSWS